MIIKSNKNKGAIVVSTRRGIWWADWSNTREARHVKVVNGSAIVPLPYLDTVPARLVCRGVSENNPGFVVITDLGLGVYPAGVK